MAADNSANYVLLNRLADEFAARYRAGQRPPLPSPVRPTRSGSAPRRMPHAGSSSGDLSMSLIGMALA